MRYVPLLAYAALLASCAAPQTHNQPTVPVVMTQPAHDRTFQNMVELSGTLEAAHTVIVGANAAGRISAMPLRVGDRVRAGSVIAQIDASAYRAAIEQAQGAVSAATANEAVASAQLHAAQVRVALARTTAARMSALYASGDISRQQHDETQAELQSALAAAEQAQAGVLAARGSITQSQGNLSAAQVPLANTAVVAPFSGIVTVKTADVGAVVVPGSPIATIQTDRDLEVDVSAPEDAAASLVPGETVQVQVDALARRSIEGTVRAIVPSDSSDSHAVTVKIAAQPSGGMIPGMFVRVYLPGAAHTAVAVAATALVNRGGQDGVFIVRDRRARFVPVETGLTAQGEVEVRGLPRHAIVAVSDVPQLTDGASIIVARSAP